MTEKKPKRPIVRIPEEEWSSPEAIAFARDFEANPEAFPEAKNIFTDLSFIRSVSGFRGFTIAEYLAHQAATNEPGFAPIFNKGTARFRPADYPELPMSDAFTPMDGMPNGHLRNVLQENGGQFPITLDLLASVADLYPYTSARLLTRETARTEEEHSLVTQIEKAAAKLGVPVVPPVFLLARSEDDELRNAHFHVGHGWCFLAFTEHYTKHPVFKDPVMQEATALHEFGHGIYPDFDQRMVYARLCHIFDLLTKDLYKVAIASGIASAALMGIEGQMKEPEAAEPMHAMALLGAQIGVVAGALGLVGRLITGYLAAGLTRELHREEFFSDAAAALNIDDPERYLALSYEASIADAEARHLRAVRSGKSEFGVEPSLPEFNLAENALVFFAKMMGLGTIKDHPLESDRAQFSRRIIDARLKAEKDEKKL